MDVTYINTKFARFHDVVSRLAWALGYFPRNADWKCLYTATKWSYYAIRWIYGGSGKLNFWLVVFAGIAGNLVGSLIAYYIGKFGGRALVLKFGKYIFLNVKHLDKAELWFGRYGARAVFFGRVLPVIRTFISLPAGIAKMNVWKFVIYTILGCIPWNIFLTWLGYSLGSNWSVVEKYTRPISYLMLALVIAIVVYLAYKVWNKRARNAK